MFNRLDSFRKSASLKLAHSLDIDPLEVLKNEVANMTQLFRGDTAAATNNGSNGNTDPTTNGAADTADDKESKQQLFGFARPNSLDMSIVNEGSEYRQMLLRNVKKEVKQIMEEAVTRKLIHEESSSITSLCAAVEACLRYGLRRRALGLFREGSTTALLQRISKDCGEAAAVLDRVVEEQPSGGGSAPLIGSSSTTNGSRGSLIDHKRSVETTRGSTKPRPSHQTKYLWIRIALLEKELAKIVEFLVNNCQKYYERESIIANPCDGPLLASLLVGPCALDYTCMKTCDHLWTDPPAGELVQRHRIHSAAHYSPSSPRKPSLMIRRHTSSSSEESLRSAPPSAKEYVESLHQNTKSTLIYGKNNVLVHPREDTEALPGYLSLHHDGAGLTLKWTPNQLMNGCQSDGVEGEESAAPVDKSLYWDYALTIPIDEVVYVHCHQKSPANGGMVVLVGQDGVQRPPLHFPAGGHLLAFLSCMENGLAPSGRLDPPLWSQRGKGPSSDQPSGKVLPKLKRRSTHRKRRWPPVAQNDRPKSMDAGHRASATEGEEEEEEEAGEDEPTDYVFRIVLENGGGQQGGRFTVGEEQAANTHFPWSNATALQERFANGTDAALQQRTSIKQLCDTMRKQILSRAFYGWLAYCRHLSTVRTHLSGLVNAEIHKDDDRKYSHGLTTEAWNKLKSGKEPMNPVEVYRTIYFGGCSHAIRREVWPFLLGHYDWSMSAQERAALDHSCRMHYEQTMSEWLAVEAIVLQQQKEQQEECLRAAQLRERAKAGKEAPEIPLCRQPSFENEVFEDRRGEFIWQFIEKLKRQWSSQTDLTTEDQSVEAEDEGFSGEAPERPSSSSTADLSIPPPLAPCKAMAKAGHPSVDSGNASEANANGSATAAPPPAEEQEAEAEVEVEAEAEAEAVAAETEAEASRKLAEPLDLREGASSRLSTSHESLMSPASPASHGGVYSKELLSDMAMNLHRIEKDVARCDRNYHFFTLDNLDKLRNIMCTYVWEHLEMGYVQGMCDLLAPLLVILEDEAMAHVCFAKLMERMSLNFPSGGAMDVHFANMRSLIQILDPELFEHMQKNGDYTHFYFCYRWFLLDFKREFVYNDVFAVWETIWSASHISSSHFGLFVALAMVKVYREIIMDNNMDFTDIIKFFNEMAERHDHSIILRRAQALVLELQELIENK